MYEYPYISVVSVYQSDNHISAAAAAAAAAALKYT